MIEKIKAYYQNKTIKEAKLASNREVNFISLANAKYVGILYEIGEENTYVWLNNYVNSLLAEGKTLRIVGYHNNKYVPHYCIPQLKYDFFCNLETNWFGKPTARFVQEFIDEPFDILLDLTLNPIFPLQYFLAKSSAHFKVGISQKEKMQFLDLMIALNENHTLNDLTFFMNDYMKKLNGE